MKKFLNLALNINMERFIIAYLFWMALLLLFYLLWLAYIVHCFFHRSVIEKQDVVVLYSGLRIQKKVLPFLKHQVFVRR